MCGVCSGVVTVWGVFWSRDGGVCSGVVAAECVLESWRRSVFWSRGGGVCSGVVAVWVPES